MTVRPARAGDLAAVLDLWGGARSAHAVTEGTPERVARVSTACGPSGRPWASPPTPVMGRMVRTL